MRLEDFLKESTESLNFTPGQVIFTEGHKASAAYYITKGKVDIFKGPPENPSIIAQLEEGQIIGEMALLRFDKYTLSAKAAEDTEVCIIPPELLLAELRQTPPLVKAILSMLVDRVHGANEVLIDLEQVSKG